MNVDVKAIGTVGVLMGGLSSEREISLKSGTAIYQALQQEGCCVIPIEIDSEKSDEVLSKIMAHKIDLAFIAMHGCFGEDGTLQKILEEAGINYTGSTQKASRLAFNKVLSQELFEENGLHVAPHIVVERNDPDIKSMLDQIPYPVFVKPTCEGSSIGITYVPEENGLVPALEVAFRYGPQALIEKAIKGKELTVGIIDKRVLPIIEICPKDTYFDFKAKYEKGKTEYIIPARLSKSIALEIQDGALKAYNLLGCRHFGRVDFMLDEDNRYYILEVNTIPGFTATSLLPKAALQSGLNFNQLCLTIIGLAYGQKKKIPDISHSR